jgi:hypothetical protein
VANLSNNSRLSPLLARKAARSLLVIVESGRSWSLSDAERCLPLGWRLNESFATNCGQTMPSLTSAFRQFASKI